MRICAVPSCSVKIDTTKIMCFPHWGRVPTPLQRNVYDTLAKYRSVAIASDAFFTIRRAYIQAAVDAIRAVKDLTS